MKPALTSPLAIGVVSPAQQRKRGLVLRPAPTRAVGLRLPPLRAAVEGVSACRDAGVPGGIVRSRASGHRPRRHRRRFDRGPRLSTPRRSLARTSRWSGPRPVHPWSTVSPFPARRVFLRPRHQGVMDGRVDQAESAVESLWITRISGISRAIPLAARRRRVPIARRPRAVRQRGSHRAIGRDRASALHSPQ